MLKTSFLEHFQVLEPSQDETSLCEFAGAQAVLEPQTVFVQTPRGFAVVRSLTLLGLPNVQLLILLHLVDVAVQRLGGLGNCKSTSGHGARWQYC